MANPQTYYTVGGTDLSGIFQPLSFGTQYSTPTGYTVTNFGDLNQIFANISSGFGISYNTGYTVGGNDLSTIFAAYNPFSVSISGTNSNITYAITNNNTYKVYSFFTISPTYQTSYTTGTCNVTFSGNKNITVILVGGGGAGGFGDYSPAGGGGGGGNFSINNISVNNSTYYSITVGSGGLAYINSQQSGQASSFIGGAINITASGGDHGGNPSQGSQSGGYSINGGLGGNANSSGNNGVYAVLTTDFGPTLNIGGGGGGGVDNTSGFNIGTGHGGNNGIGGLVGTQNVSTQDSYGSGYGAGGGGGGGYGSQGGGVGASGLLIFYYAI